MVRTSSKEEKQVLKETVTGLEEELLDHSYDFIDLLECFIGGLVVSFLIALQQGFDRTVASVTWGKVGLVIGVTVLILLYKIYHLGYTWLEEHHKEKFKFYFVERVSMTYLLSLFAGILAMILVSNADPIKGMFLLALPGSMGGILIDLLRRK